MGVSHKSIILFLTSVKTMQQYLSSDSYKGGTCPHSLSSSTYMKPLVHLTVDLLPEILSS